MFCSTIIPTIGRPSVNQAVCSILEQNFSQDFEIIVVNDSAKPLPEADWQKSERVRVINTSKRERSVARNTGAAIAKGKYLHFLDDDDLLLPGALASFWELAQANPDNAFWLAGASQLVDRKGNQLIKLHHKMQGNCFVQMMAGEWIPIGGWLIEAKTFFAIGGFNPLMPTTEDVELYRRIALQTDLQSMDKIVVSIGMGAEGSTTDRVRSSAYSRFYREQILNQSGIFNRMRTSATTGNWRGRMVRIYLTSAVWNLQHKRGLIAVSRAMFGLLALMLSGRHLLSASFWRAITKKYESETFLDGFQEANNAINRPQSANKYEKAGA